MIIYWVLGIVLVIWIVHEVMRKKSTPSSSGSADDKSSETGHNKSKDSCCH